MGHVNGYDILNEKLENKSDPFSRNYWARINLLLVFVSWAVNHPTSFAHTA